MLRLAYDVPCRSRGFISEKGFRVWLEGAESAAERAVDSSRRVPYGHIGEMLLAGVLCAVEYVCSLASATSYSGAVLSPVDRV